MPIASTERHRGALDRMKAFLAVLEGYGSEAMSVVGPQIVPEHAARIDEGMARQRFPSRRVEALWPDPRNIARSSARDARANLLQPQS